MFSINLSGCLCLFQESLRVEYVLVDIIALAKQQQPDFDLTMNDVIAKDNSWKITLGAFQVQDMRELTLKRSLTKDPIGKIESLLPRQKIIFTLDQEKIFFAEIGNSFSQLRRAIKKVNLSQHADYMLYSLNRGLVQFSRLLGEFFSKDASLTQILKNWVPRTQSLCLLGCTNLEGSKTVAKKKM